MKNLICLSVFVLFIISLSAQGSILDSTKRHEFGFAVQGLLGGGGGGYGFTYRYHFKNGAFRSGVNIGGNLANTEIDDSSSDGSENDNRSFFVSTRLGYEGHIWLTPKWMTYIGGDIIARQSNSSRANRRINGTQIFENKNTTNSTRIGFAPLIGVRFQVTPRISFGTELRYIGAFTFQKQTAISNSGQPNSVTTKTSTTFFDSYFEKPAAIYLQINL